MPTGPITVPEINVPNEDALAFLQAMEAGISDLPDQWAHNLYLVVDERRAVAVSLDGRSQAFLGFSRGYNVARYYLPSGIRFLQQIADVLAERNLPIPGGRLFIRQYSAHKVIDDLEETLCTYDWPLQNPVAFARRLLRERLFTRQ